MAIQVEDKRGASRFELTEDGEFAAAAYYERGKGAIAFTHTETEPGFEGRGIAKQLVTAALDAAREEGLEVLPFCPYVKKFIAGNDEYLDLVPEGRRAEFGL